jgi:rhamnose transport system permease protein
MIVLLFAEPAYFSRENLTDIFLANMPVMIIALGMTLIILTGQIDISVGSIFAICSVIAGITARRGYPGVAGVLAACIAGAVLGAVNGGLVGYVKVPSIVVTLATMVALRDGLRWSTQGSWIGDLPGKFQWLGLTQTHYIIFMFAIVTGLVLCIAWGLHFLSVGRKVFATGSNENAARIVGIDTRRVVFAVFTLTGALSGLAAVLNAVRFRQIPSNSGLGLEMKVIAAVAVGGASITGGAATITGTVLGVVLLGSNGTALTFLGVSAYWEKAIQGAIILGAIAINVISQKREKNATRIEALAG